MFDVDSWAGIRVGDDVNAQPSKEGEFLISRLRRYTDFDCGVSGSGLIGQRGKKGGEQYA